MNNDDNPRRALLPTLGFRFHQIANASAAKCADNAFIFETLGEEKEEYDHVALSTPRCVLAYCSAPRNIFD